MKVVDLAERRTLRIGGSEAAAACGVDPFRSRVMLWAEKTGKYPREQTEPMLWGKLLEPVIKEEVARRGYEVHEYDGLRMPDLPEWFHGTPDGYASDEDGTLAVLEVKTGNHWSAHDWRSRLGAPLPYIMQVQHYLHLTGAARGLLACLIEGQRLELRTVERNEDVIALMLEREAEILEHVRTDTAPDPDGSKSTGDAIRALYPEASGETIRLSQAGWARCKALRARQEQLKAVKRQADELKQAIQLEMGEAVAAMSPYDEVAVRWTSGEKTALNIERFKAERPELFGLFAETTSVRRFTLS